MENIKEINCSLGVKVSSLASQAGDVGAVPTESIYCDFCKKELKSIKAYNSHKGKCNKNPNSKNFNRVWICPICNASVNTEKELAIHRANFHRGMKRELTEEEKAVRHEKLSKIAKASMKKRLENGTWCGWTKRVKGSESFAEAHIRMFLQQENIFQGCIQELQVGRYFLDFAWPEKMICVEIDGHQHFDDIKRAESDIRKNNFLNKNGWKLLRLRYDDVYNDNENAYKLLKEFIITSNIDEDRYNKFLKEGEKRRKAKEDYKKRIENLKQEGRVNSLGRANPRKINEEDLSSWKNMILDSGVDLLKYGWVSEVVKITGLSKKRIRLVVRHFNIHNFERARKTGSNPVGTRGWQPNL